MLGLTDLEPTHEARTAKRALNLTDWSGNLSPVSEAHGDELAIEVDHERFPGPFLGDEYPIT
jgi:hypothetical protein